MYMPNGSTVVLFSADYNDKRCEKWQVSVGFEYFTLQNRSQVHYTNNFHPFKQKTEKVCSASPKKALASAATRIDYQEKQS